MSSKQEIINNLKVGDIILIDYTKELNKYEDEEDLEELEEDEQVKKRNYCFRSIR